MSITFQQFLDKTGYTPPYAARAVLYHPESRPALLAKTLELDVDGERSIMTNVCANKKTVVGVRTRSEHSAKPKPASPQIDLIENVKSKPVDNAA